MNRARLLLLHDSPQFGGHEVMLLNLLPGVIAAGDFDGITACFPESNTRLADGLAALGPLVKLKPWRFEKRRAEPYLGFSRRKYAEAVRDIVTAEDPVCTLLVQGRIENLVAPMGAVPRDRFLVSYVPMAHRLADMGRNGLIGDAVRRRLYGRPDRFIVPSHSVAEQVAAAGARGEIVVADNFVETPPPIASEAARRRLDLPADRRIALFLGRLDPAQKGLDRLVRAIGGERQQLRDWTFLFVGDGEGRAMLDALAGGENGLDVRVVPWTDQPAQFLAAADLLLMPSRWEGVPLVMLEAMAMGLPILASPIDVFREYLPAECLADFAGGGLAARMDWLAEPEGVARYAAAIAPRLAEPVRERARARFAKALLPDEAPWRSGHDLRYVRCRRTVAGSPTLPPSIAAMEGHA